MKIALLMGMLSIKKADRVKKWGCCTIYAYTQRPRVRCKILHFATHPFIVLSIISAIETALPRL